MFVLVLIVIYRNVSFKYPGTTEYALKDVSFKLEAGQLCVSAEVDHEISHAFLKPQ